MCLQSLLCESYSAQAIRRAERGASKPSNIVVTCRDDAAKDLTVGKTEISTFRGALCVRMSFRNISAK
jgi:hypothetical protein